MVLLAALWAVYAGQTYVQPDVAALLDAARAEPDEHPTAKELDVLHLMAEGYCNKEIARRLHIRERTVEFHIGNLLGKLSATSRTAAVHRARQKHWPL